VPGDPASAESAGIGLLEFPRELALPRSSCRQVLTARAVAGGDRQPGRSTSIGTRSGRIQPGRGQGGIGSVRPRQGIEQIGLGKSGFGGQAKTKTDFGNKVRNAFLSTMERLRIPAVLLVAIAHADLSCPVISEIAAAPTSGNTEWIELADLSGSGSDVSGWTLDDGSVRRSIAAGSRVAAGGFLVVAADCAKLKAQFGTSSIPCAQTAGWSPLSQEDDRVVLRDPQGRLCDSVAWSHSSWGDWPTGRSLERIDFSRSGNNSANWVASSAALGGTPGWKGEIALEPIGGELGVEMLARRVRPGLEPVRIRLRSPWNLRVKAEAYDLSRRKVATFFDGQIPASGELEWDARSQGRIVPPGVYAVVIEFGPAGRFAGKGLFREWLVVEK